MTRSRHSVNTEGLTFEEWDDAARLGERKKVETVVEVRRAAYASALALSGALAAEMLYPRGVYYGVALSHGKARAAWKAGEDPAEYAALPRPIPRGT